MASLRPARASHDALGAWTRGPAGKRLSRQPLPRHLHCVLTLDWCDVRSPAERSRSPANKVLLDHHDVYRVVILGAQGVGKSSLVQQFSTSDFLHAYCASPGKSNPQLARFSYS